MDDTTRIAILGKTGTGKSSLGNTIFEEKHFLAKTGPNSGTSECQAKTKSVYGRSITLIDTPGIFDTDRTEEELKYEVLSCITEFAPGPHAFLIVLKVETYTKQEQAVIIEIQKYFTEEVYKYATVVFTHGDQFDEGQTIEDFCHESEPLRDLVEKCGGRCHVIDNKYWNDNPNNENRSNQYHVKMLLNTIHEMIEKNKGSCYTNEMLQAVEEEIQQEVESISLLPGNMTKEEIREQAKASVFRGFLIKLAGTATGVLLGALFGVGGCVVIVIRCLTKLGEVAGAKVAAAGEAIAAEGKALQAASESGLAANTGQLMTDAGKVVKAVGKAAKAAAEAAQVEGKVTAGQTAVAGGVGVGVGGAAVAIAARGTAAAGTVAVGTAAAVLGGSAVIGGAMGGVAGYKAAEGAETEWEAMKRAKEAVSTGSESFVNNALDFLNIQSGQQ